PYCSTSTLYSLFSCPQSTPPRSTLFPYTTLFRSQFAEYERLATEFPTVPVQVGYVMPRNPQVSTLLAELSSGRFGKVHGFVGVTDRKSTRLNSSHQIISYAVFCLKKKNKRCIETR